MWVVVLILILILYVEFSGETEGVKSRNLRKRRKKIVSKRLKSNHKKRNSAGVGTTTDLRSKSIQARNRSTAIKRQVNNRSRGEPSIEIKETTQSVVMMAPKSNLWRAEPSEMEKVGASARVIPWRRVAKEMNDNITYAYDGARPLSGSVSKSPYPVLTEQSGASLARIKSGTTSTYERRIFVPGHPVTNFVLNTAMDTNQGKNQYMSRGERFLIAEGDFERIKYHFRSAKFPENTPLLIEQKQREVSKKVLRVGGIRDLVGFLRYHQIESGEIYLTVLTEAGFKKEQEEQYTRMSQKFASCVAAYSSVGLSRDEISLVCGK